MGVSVSDSIAWPALSGRCQRLPARPISRRFSAASVDPAAARRYAALMPLEFAISALVTLLVVVDPVGLAPTFLAVTDGLSARHRRQVALRASLIAAAILI